MNDKWNEERKWREILDEIITKNHRLLVMWLNNIEIKKEMMWQRAYQTIKSNSFKEILLDKFQVKIVTNNTFCHKWHFRMIFTINLRKAGKLVKAW